MTKIVIVGGVAGGMSAATRLRRLMEDAEIIVFDKGPYVSFANCGLPYYVSGEIDQRSKLVVQTPEALKARFKLDVRLNHEVIKINSDQKKITYVNNEGEFEESYDKLILSPGAKPFVPNLPGLDQAKNTFGLRNIPDLDQMLDYLSTNHIQRVTVIGAGLLVLKWLKT